MVQWKDPALETYLAIIVVNMEFLLLGVYSWEYLQSLDVEYAVIRGRMSFRWPLIPYLVGRLSVLTTLVLLTVEAILEFRSCQPVMSAAVLGNTAVACSSANLMIRTWLIWKDTRAVYILLLLVALGHWTILTLDVANINAFTSNGVCAVRLVRPMLNAGVYAYTMFYDFLVFALSIGKLSKLSSKSSLEGHLRSQCLLYFSVAVMANIPPTVFAFLGSTGMMAMTGCFAMTASTIVSCRAVRSLLDLRTPHSNGHTLDESVTGKPDAVLTTSISVDQLPSTILTNV